MTTGTTHSARANAEGEAAAARVETRPQLRWSPRLANDIDPVAVDRACHGDPSAISHAWERREAVRLLRENGDGILRIAATLHMGGRQVVRDLRRLGLSDQGRYRVRREQASARRPLVAALFAAGARRGEIVRLLGITPGQVKRDFDALNIPGTGPMGTAPLRTYDELAATFGHLLAGYDTTEATA